MCQGHKVVSVYTRNKFVCAVHVGRDARMYQGPHV